jgi:PTS system fructose-specific IIA component
MNIDEKLVFLNENFRDKNQVIDYLTSQLQNNGYVEQPGIEFKQHVLQRESDTSTDMGNDIAIPHAKSQDIKKPFIAYVQLTSPIPWNEKQGSQVSMVFMLGVPERADNGVHLQMLSGLARKLIDEDFLATIKETDDPQKVVQLLEQ